jgi:hypothetical protein
MKRSSCLSSPGARPAVGRWRALLMTAVLATPLCGCVIHQQYRTSLEPCELRPGVDARRAAIEIANGCVLGLVEFDDQGWLWQREQMERVLEHLQALDQTNSLLLLTYVHGWKHNASFADKDVQLFRGVLQQFRELEVKDARHAGLPPRTVAGVYVGWRGASVPLPLLKQLSFWERKETAHEVGWGALTELFVRLESLRDASRKRHSQDRLPTRLVIVGHSFGGAATYSALAPLFVERFVQSLGETNQPSRLRGFGDLVVLVNPAFEAARFHVLRDLAEHQISFAHQPANIAIFTSKSDWATRAAFPVGRSLSTLFESYQHREQGSANLHAVGHFAPFVTHHLVPREPEAAPPPPAAAKPAPMPVRQVTLDESYENIQAVREQMRPAEQSQVGLRRKIRFSRTELQLTSPAQANMPLLVVQVDKRIIRNHGDINRPVFRDFLREFLLGVLAEEPGK